MLFQRLAVQPQGETPATAKREVLRQLKGMALVADACLSSQYAGKPQRGPWHRTWFMVRSAITGTYLPLITCRPDSPGRGRGEGA